MKVQYPETINQDQLAHLYQQYAPKILIYLSRRINSNQDAEDILIDIFVAALESTSFARLTEQEQNMWLWRVAHNKVVDIYRKTKNSAIHSIDCEVIEDIMANPEQISIQQEEDSQLALLITRLSPLQQRVLYLRFGENLRCAQIASLMGKREGSIRSLLSRTFHLLRHQYRNSEEGGYHHGIK